MGVFRVYKFIFVTYPVCMIYPAKKILFVLYRALSPIIYVKICSDDFNSFIPRFHLIVIEDQTHFIVTVASVL